MNFPWSSGLYLEQLSGTPEYVPWRPLNCNYYNHAVENYSRLGLFNTAHWPLPHQQHPHHHYWNNFTNANFYNYDAAFNRNYSYNEYGYHASLPYIQPAANNFSAPSVDFQYRPVSGWSQEATTTSSEMNGNIECSFQNSETESFGKENWGKEQVESSNDVNDDLPTQFDNYKELAYDMPRAENTTNLKRKLGNGLEDGVLASQNLDEYTSKYYEPVYVLDAAEGIFMCSYVKFYRSLDNLHCLYPNCLHSEHLSGYFTHQYSLQNFRSHVRCAHRKVKRGLGYASKNFFYCHVCQAQLTSRDILVEHLETQHPTVEWPPVLCEICEDVMPHSDIINHIISHKSKEEKKVAFTQSRSKVDITKPLVFPCDECNKTFKTHQKLRTHKLTHIRVETGKRFKCDVCDKQFIRLDRMEDHKRRMHSALYCKYCGKKYLSHGEVDAMHVNLFNDDDFIGPKQMYPCEPCNLSFNIKCRLIKHLNGTRHNFSLKSIADYPTMWTVENELAWNSKCLYGK